jgi:hypothetical protein
MTKLVEGFIRALGLNRVHDNDNDYQSFVANLKNSYNLLTMRRVSNVIARISVLPYLPNAGGALDLLNRLARKVEPLVLSNGLFVHHLTEYLPRAEFVKDYR